MRTRIWELVLGTGTVVTCMGKILEFIFGRRTLFACNVCNAYFCFLGIDGWMAERTDGRMDEKTTPVYTNWHLMQRIGSWLAHPCW